VTVLLTLADAEAYLDVTSDSGGPIDTLVQTCRDAAQDAFDQYTNRRLREAVYTHQMDGNGLHMLVARQFPIVSISSIKVDPAWVFGSGTLVPSTDYIVENDTLLLKKTVWEQGIRNYQMVYTAGYGGAVPVPPDIVFAMKLLVEFLYHGRDDQRLGIQARGKVGETLTFLEDVPKTIWTLIDQYERKNAIAKAQAAGG